jgi:hypothetical protein
LNVSGRIDRTERVDVHGGCNRVEAAPTFDLILGSTGLLDLRGIGIGTFRIVATASRGKHGHGLRQPPHRTSHLHARVLH